MGIIQRNWEKIKNNKDESIILKNKKEKGSNVIVALKEN